MQHEAFFSSPPLPPLRKQTAIFSLKDPQYQCASNIWPLSVRLQRKWFFTYLFSFNYHLLNLLNICSITYFSVRTSIFFAHLISKGFANWGCTYPCFNYDSQYCKDINCVQCLPKQQIRGWLKSNIISHLKQKLWVGEISILIEFIYKFIGLSFNTD